MNIKKILGGGAAGALMLGALIVPAFAAVNAVTPSTNDINRTNSWAHVDQLSQGVGTTDLQFISTRAFYSCFEYRTDGNTSQVLAQNGGVNYNTNIIDGLYPYYCQNNNSSTHTISANGYVEVRMVFGAETDERFDWTRFDVLQPPPVTVTIAKYFNGVPATADLTGSASYPMASSWNATNIGAGSGFYALGSSGFNNPNPYQATTSDMTSGASYSTNEVTNATNGILPIGTQCQIGRTILVGYSTGDTLALAAASAPVSISPNFTNITSNQFVVVWNQSCVAPTLKDQCKNDGWKTFNAPTFKNQGQCVSYVQANGHAGKKD